MNKIGFIGLGIMGSRMARNLQQAGFELLVWNRTPDKADELVAHGATLAESAAAVAEGVDVLITMLGDPPAVEAVSAEFLPAMRSGALWMDCSTVHPRFARANAAQAAEHGVRFIESPVAGTKQPAADGTLLFLMGGDEADIDEVLPLVEAMGRRHIHVGPHGMGASLKVVVNNMLANTMVAFAESAALAEGLGIPQEQIFNILIGSAVTPPFVEGKREKMESGAYEPDFPLKWTRKDLRMAAEAAADIGMELPYSGAAGAVMQAAMDAGYADDDFSAVYGYVKGE